MYACARSAGQIPSGTLGGVLGAACPVPGLRVGAGRTGPYRAVDGYQRSLTSVVAGLSGVAPRVRYKALSAFRGLRSSAVRPLRIVLGISRGSRSASREDSTALAARVEEMERGCLQEIADVRAEADARIAEARADAERAGRERDDAVAALRDVRVDANVEIGRVRQAEVDARAEVDRVREDVIRERDALRESREAQVAVQRALTETERARAERAEAQLEKRNGLTGGS